jgi:hypothetical protein
MFLDLLKGNVHTKQKAADLGIIAAHIDARGKTAEAYFRIDT